MKFLFVCLGNNCKSVMAEAIFRDLTIKKNLNVFVDSCGTSVDKPGQLPHLCVRKELEIHKISCNGIVSRQIIIDDFDYFDYIIAMSEDTFSDLKILKNIDKIYKITDFCEDLKEEKIPDPYYYNNFYIVYDIIQKYVFEIINKLT